MSRFCKCTSIIIACFLTFGVGKQAFPQSPKTESDPVGERIVSLKEVYLTYFANDPEMAYKIQDQIQEYALANGRWIPFFVAKLDKSALYIDHDNWPLVRQMLDSAWMAMDRYGTELSGEYRQAFKDNFELREASYCIHGLGDYARASEILDDLISQSNLSSIVNAAYRNKNELLMSMGNFQEANLNTQQWLKWEANRPISIPHRNSKGAIQKHKAFVQKALGNFEAAKKGYKEALSSLFFYFGMCQRNNDQGYITKYRNAIVSTYNDMADLSYQLGEVDSSYYWLKRSLAVEGSAIKNRDVYPRLGKIYSEQGQPDSAMLYYGLGLKAVENNFGKTSFRRAKVLAMMAQTQALQGLHTDALSIFQEAANSLLERDAPQDPLVPPSFAHAYSPKDFLQIIRLKTESLFHLYKMEEDDTYLDAAWDHFQMGLSLIDSLHTTHGNKQDKRFLVDESYPFFELGLKLASILYAKTEEPVYQEAMFSILEKSKGIMLRNTLSQTHFDAPIPKELRDKEQKLTRQLKDLNQDILGLHVKGPDEEGFRELKDSLLTVKAESDRLVNTIRKQFPDYYQLKYDSETLSLNAAKARIPDHQTALVSYFLGDSTLHIVCISQKGTQVFSSKNAQEVQSLTERYVSRLRDPGNLSPRRIGDSGLYRDFVLEGNQLYKALLEPIGALDYPKLILIPDGILGLIPFESLVTDVNQLAAVDYRSLPYVLRECAVNYQQSATLAFGENSFQRNATKPYLGIAPSYEGNPQLSSVRLNEGFIQSLEDTWQGEFISGEMAKESFFKTQAQAYHILHFHGHAMANPKAPLYSWLAFTTGGASNPGLLASAGGGGETFALLGAGEDVEEIREDGYLFSYELYNLKLNAALVVLSACETGSGKILRGEGVMSMAHAFRFAGCPNILMPLWKAENNATQRLTQQFFAELKDGKGKASALRIAKLDYLKNADYPHPFFWSSFVLMGDGEPVVPGSNGLLWVLGGLGLVLICLIWKIKMLLKRPVRPKEGLTGR